MIALATRRLINSFQGLMLILLVLTAAYVSIGRILINTIDHS